MAQNLSQNEVPKPNTHSAHKNKLKLYKKISLFSTLRFSFKNIAFDKTIITLVSVSLVLTLAFSLTYISFDKKHAELVKSFNYYFIILICVFNSILIMRIVQFFMNIKMDDKTIYITIMQQISRPILLISLWLVTFMMIVIMLVSNYLLMNILQLIATFHINKILFRISTVFLIYGLIFSTAIISFFFLICLILKAQMVTIIATFLISFSFINTLPFQFLTQHEKLKKIEVEGNVFTVPEVYNAMDYQKAVGARELKFPSLAKYVNEELLNPTEDKINEIVSDGWYNEAYEFLNRRNFQEPDQIKYRLKWIWEELGLVHDVERVISLENLNLQKTPDEWGSSIKPENGPVNLNFVVTKKFDTYDELVAKSDEEIDPTKKAVLKELVLFWDYIIEEQIDNEHFQKNNTDLFDDFIFLKEEENSDDPEFNYLTQGDTKQVLKVKNIQDVYKNFFWTYGNGLRVSDDSGNLDELISAKNAEGNSDSLFDPLMLMARILENYMLPLTTNYNIIINKTVSSTQDAWLDYIKERNKFNLFWYVNVFSNSISSFTHYSGFAYDEIWFKPNMTSSINFSEQQNTFLAYPSYTLKIEKGGDYGDKISPTSYNNFPKPIIFLLLQFFLGVVNFGVAIILFNRKDLK